MEFTLGIAEGFEMTNDPLVVISSAQREIFLDL